MKALGLIAAFAATVPVANWMIGNIGTVCDDGVCLIPVGLGLMAPSGVLVIGAALVLRDAVHEVAGIRGALFAILAGAMLSLWFAPPALAIASVAAFTLAETADLAVYAPLRRRSRPLAVLASGIVGAFADSALFLWLAFGSLDYLAGHTLGKVMVSAAAAAFLLSRRWRAA